MLSSTRSNKEYLLLFSDPTRLERIIHKEKCAASIDNKSDPSTDTRELPPIDTSIRTLIDIHPRDMVATLVLMRDENGDLHDHEGYLRNAEEEVVEEMSDCRSTTAFVSIDGDPRRRAEPIS
uniref:Uncharacterized protein n=1 Tax=Brassica campestris TaxID=3711 RepID=M4EV82_BRACM